MQTYARKPLPPKRNPAQGRLWRWFWRGLVLWVVLAAGAAILLAGNVGPLYREARHLFVGLSSSLSARSADTADFVPIAHTGENLFGVNTFLYQEVEE
jgi:hypothetical protein